jgi:hypothetical protein
MLSQACGRFVARLLWICALLCAAEASSSSNGARVIGVGVGTFTVILATILAIAGCVAARGTSKARYITLCVRVFELAPAQLSQTPSHLCVVSS